MEVGQEAYREASGMEEGSLIPLTGLEAEEFRQEAYREAGMM